MSFAWRSTTCGPPRSGPSHSGVRTTRERFSRPSRLLLGAQLARGIEDVRAAGRPARILARRPTRRWEAGDVLLSALACQTYLGSALGYDEKLDAIARACLPVLRERRLTRELGVCLLALGTNDCYRDVYAESAVNLEEAVDVARSAGDHLVVAARFPGSVSCVFSSMTSPAPGRRSRSATRFRRSSEAR